MPEIMSGSRSLLATKNGKEIYFQRDGLAAGHLVVSTCKFSKLRSKSKTKILEIEYEHFPTFRYWDGFPEDKLVGKYEYLKKL